MSQLKSGQPRAKVSNLSVFAPNRLALVKNASFEISAGECVAIVGESGAGKSLLTRALLQLVDQPLNISAQGIQIFSQQGEEVDQDMIHTQVGYVAQDALQSLDPLMRIAPQVAEALEFSAQKLAAPARNARTVEALSRAHLSPLQELLRAYPGELSGGMRQRALIAAATVHTPALIVADEPTTALDATVQRRVLATLREYVDSGTSLILVSHDLAAVSEIADRVMVMQSGVIVESGPTREILENPRSSAAQALVSAQLVRPGQNTKHAYESRGKALMRVRDLTVRYQGAEVDAVSVPHCDVVAGRTLAVVGESGSGKTTLGRAILGVVKPSSGTVTTVAPTESNQPLRLAWVPQDARSSFTRGVRVSGVLREAIRTDKNRRQSRSAETRYIESVLERVGLPFAVAGRKAQSLSGGQAQRLAIARALAIRPDVLVCDEPISALDSTLRVKIVELLARIQQEDGLAMVYISHELTSVERLADQVLVLQDGIVVEQGTREQIFSAPKHHFTQELLTASGRII